MHAAPFGAAFPARALCRSSSSCCRFGATSSHHPPRDTTGRAPSGFSSTVDCCVASRSAGQAPPWRRWRRLLQACHHLVRDSRWSPSSRATSIRSGRWRGRPRASTWPRAAAIRSFGFGARARTTRRRGRASRLWRRCTFAATAATAAVSRQMPPSADAGTAPAPPPHPTPPQTPPRPVPPPTPDPTPHPRPHHHHHPRATSARCGAASGRRARRTLRA